MKFIKCITLIIFFIILIFLIYLAIGFKTGHIGSYKEGCYHNLHMLEECVESFAMCMRYPDGKRISDDDLKGFIPQKLQRNLQCPSGGVYTNFIVGQRPICSYHGDLLAPNQRQYF